MHACKHIYIDLKCIRGLIDEVNLPAWSGGEDVERERTYAFTLPGRIRLEWFGSARAGPASKY